MTVTIIILAVAAPLMLAGMVGLYRAAWRRSTARPSTEIWTMSPCTARAAQPTPAEAHLDWRNHQRCQIETCPRLRTARYVLIAHGRFVPAERGR